jgi:hypothetical protein
MFRILIDLALLDAPTLYPTCAPFINANSMEAKAVEKR